MKPAESEIRPDHTAVRVALWRALHTLLDNKPHVFTDEIGLKLVNEMDWRNRPDMDPEFSKPMRASIVARAKFIESTLFADMKNGIKQYVILGAGLDTFAQRCPEFASQLQIYEVDQPGPQKWKQQRLLELGYQIPNWLHFVPVDFEANQSWWDMLLKAGFDPKLSTLVVSTGVSMYLTKEANAAALRKIAKLAANSIFCMTFMLSLELLEPSERSTLEFVMNRAKQSGTPFLSLFSPTEILDLAKKSGFLKSKYVSAEDLFQLYFAQRTDGLRAGQAEAFLVAHT